MCSCIPACCQNQTAGLILILTFTLIPEVFCIWVTACWSEEGLWICRAINIPACISHKGQLLLQELFCWIKKMPCLQLQRRILHLTWTSAAAAADQSLPDPYNLESITAYLSSLRGEMFQTYNNTSRSIKRRQKNLSELLGNKLSDLSAKSNNGGKTTLYCSYV